MTGVDIVIASDIKLWGFILHAVALLMMWQGIAKPISWKKYICPSPSEGMGTTARFGHTMEMANYQEWEWKKVQNSDMGIPSEQPSLKKWHTSFWADFKGSLSSLMIYCYFFWVIKKFLWHYSLFIPQFLGHLCSGTLSTCHLKISHQLVSWENWFEALQISLPFSDYSFGQF